MEALYEATQRDVDAVRLSASETKEKELENAQTQFDNELTVIDQRSDLDEAQKQNLKTTVQLAANRRLETRRVDIQREEQVAIDRALREQRLSFEEDRMWVKLRGIGIPATLIFMLVIIVVAIRLRAVR